MNRLQLNEEHALCKAPQIHGNRSIISFPQKTVMAGGLFFLFIWLEYGIGILNIADLLQKLGITIPTDAANLFSYFLMLVSAVVIFRKELFQELRQPTALWKSLAWSFPIFFIGCMATNMLGNFLPSFLVMNSNQEPAGSAPILFQILIGCILAPAAEELYFRFFLYNHLRKKSVFLAIAVSSVLFAFWHTAAAILAGNMTQLIMTLPYLPAGIALALIYEKTGSIKYPILIHSINNAYSTMLLLLALG